MITNLPNLLTLSRIAAIPVIVALFYIEGDTARWAALAVFSAAAVTDYFDGYFARLRREHSMLGRFLDPIADKLLIASVILLLVAFDRITGWTVIPALIILSREIMVSGLREFLAGLNVRVPVSRLAKWKTTIQMFAMGFFIVGDASPDVIPAILIGEIGLWSAALLTLVTGYSYFRSGFAHMIRSGREKAPKSADLPRRTG
ncbi:MAG: CDP-diacylglycerol--glycerol-3-phosphate 3-phosphatidyltransferase [Alphaproteobacteria bacterium]|jgi:cardiolipin synthase